jgi:hypothetical protein
MSDMLRTAHINYEVRKKEPPAPGADNTAQVVD